MKIAMKQFTEAQHLSVLRRPLVTSAVSNRLHGTDVTTWDSNLWRLAYWYRA